MSVADKLASKIFYEATGMDPMRVQKIVDTELAGSDEGELYLESRVSEYMGMAKKRRVLNFEVDRGFGIRFTSGESVAFRASADLTEAGIQKEAQTVKAIRHATPGTIAIPSQEIVMPPDKLEIFYQMDNPLNDYNHQDKVDLIRKINDYVRAADSRIKDAGVSLSAEYSVVQILRPHMAPISDIRPLVRLNVSATAEKGRKREAYGTGTGGRYGYTRLFNEATWKGVADEALRVALLLLEAKEAPAGDMTVVLGSGWPGVMLHEAVGHGLEGDFNRKGTSVFSGRVGQQVASKGITVIDQGNIADRRGSLHVDDEGTPTQANVLIEDGILRGYMQDRMNARLMGVAPTGNGRRENYRHAPIPRMTNTFIAAGKHDPQEIIGSIKKGIYAPGFSGGSVDITSGRFNFDMKEAYVVLDGKIQYPVRGATMIGKGSVAMNEISMVGTDSRLDPGVGTCGKEGQSVPVGVGQPTLRLDKITVGGRGGPL